MPASTHVCVTSFPGCTMRKSPELPPRVLEAVTVRGVPSLRQSPSTVEVSCVVSPASCHLGAPCRSRLTSCGVSQPTRLLCCGRIRSRIIKLALLIAALCTTSCTAITLAPERSKPQLQRANKVLALRGGGTGSVPAPVVGANPTYRRVLRAAGRGCVE